MTSILDKLITAKLDSAYMTVPLGFMLRQLYRTYVRVLLMLDYAAQWILRKNLVILIFLSAKGCYVTSLESVIVGISNVYCRRENVLFYFLT